MVGAEAELDERPRVGRDLGLPAVVRLVLGQGVFGGLVPNAGRLAAEVMLAESERSGSRACVPRRCRAVRATVAARLGAVLGMMLGGLERKCGSWRSGNASVSAWWWLWWLWLPTSLRQRATTGKIHTANWKIRFPLSNNHLCDKSMNSRITPHCNEALTEGKQENDIPVPKMEQPAALGIVGSFR